MPVQESPSLPLLRKGQKFIKAHPIFRSRLEKHHVQEVLGQGSFGLVLKAQQIQTKQIFALKIVEIECLKVFNFGNGHQRYRKSSLNIGRPYSEVRNSRKLPQHLNVVSYHGRWIDALSSKDFSKWDLKKYDEEFTNSDETRRSSGNSDESHERKQAKLPLYLVVRLKYCNGGDLKNWLDIHNTPEKRPFQLVFEFVQDLMSGLSHIHNGNLIHRDLKPANIFMNKSAKDERFILKIGDFGLSCINLRTRGKNRGSTSIKQKQDFHYKGFSYKSADVGSDPYMSPQVKSENCARWRRYSNKADIYSLGVIILEILCPFKTYMEKIQIMDMLKAGNIKDFEDFPSSFDCVKPLLTRMVAYAEEDRPTVCQAQKEWNELFGWTTVKNTRGKKGRCRMRELPFGNNGSARKKVIKQGNPEKLEVDAGDVGQFWPFQHSPKTPGSTEVFIGQLSKSIAAQGKILLG